MQPSPTAGPMALILLWSVSDPTRAGERIVVPPGGTAILGRADPQIPDGALLQERPGQVVRRPGLRDPFVSRHQLEVTLREGAFHLENVGRCPMMAGGIPARSARLGPGDTVTLVGRAVIGCVLRPPMPTVPHAHRFGAPDPWDRVGESPPAWGLRAALQKAESAPGSILLEGNAESGTLELVRALHRRLPERGAPLVRWSPDAPAGAVWWVEDLHRLSAADRDRFLTAPGAARRIATCARGTAGPLVPHFVHRVRVPPVPTEDVPLWILHELRGQGDLVWRDVDGPHVDPDLVDRLVRTPPRGGLAGLRHAVRVAVESRNGNSLGLTPEVEGLLERR